MSYEATQRAVDIERRGYGRRYTWLPVDSLSRDGFTIDFTDAYTRPEMIDILLGDIVRWREGEQLIEGSVAEVRRESAMLHVRIERAHPLPPGSFYP